MVVTGFRISKPLSTMSFAYWILGLAIPLVIQVIAPTMTIGTGAPTGNIWDIRVTLAAQSGPLSKTPVLSLQRRTRVLPVRLVMCSDTSMMLCQGTPEDLFGGGGIANRGRA